MEIKNERIRDCLTLHGIRHWELAKLLNVSEFTLCRKLREELPEEEQNRICEIIEREAKKRE